MSYNAHCAVTFSGVSGMTFKIRNGYCWMSYRYIKTLARYKP